MWDFVVTRRLQGPACVLFAADAVTCADYIHIVRFLRGDMRGNFFNFDEWANIEINNPRVNKQADEKSKETSSVLLCSKR